MWVKQWVFAVVATLLDENKKQEEKKSVMLSSESMDFAEWVLIGASTGAVLSALDGPTNNVDRLIWWRDRDDFVVKMLGEVVLFAHGAREGRLNDSITC
eukprot:3906517-Ditylum_brightwellii.AAC.1